MGACELTALAGAPLAGWGGAAGTMHGRAAPATDPDLLPACADRPPAPRAPDLIAFIPSPSANGFHVGPLFVHASAFRIFEETQRIDNSQYLLGMR